MQGQSNSVTYSREYDFKDATAQIPLLALENMILDMPQLKEYE